MTGCDDEDCEDDAEDGADDNADDTEEDAALDLERVLSLGPGPITCSNQHGVESVQQTSAGAKECGPKRTVQIQSSVGHGNAHTEWIGIYLCRYKAMYCKHREQTREESK